MSRTRPKAYKDVILGDPCVFCHRDRSTTRITVDHIQPSSRGGDNHWFNYAPACSRCNRIKGNTTLLEFLFKGKKKVRQSEMMFTESVSLAPELIEFLQTGTGEYSYRWPLYALLDIDHRKPFV